MTSALQTVDVGTTPNDDTGDSLRTAMGKINQNFDEIKSRVLYASDYGAVGSGSDETAAVQDAIDDLPVGGGLVVINRGVKFSLTSLTFAQRTNLQYCVDDETSAPGQSGDIGSGEWVFFSANSSYPSDPTGAAVNEWRFTAPFHPGIVIDARKDVDGADDYLAGAQSRLEPVRASLNIHDEQTDAGRLVYESYVSGSNFSMLQLHAWRRVVTLNGIDTGSFVSVPAEGTILTGATSGAKGMVLSVGASSTTVLWLQGKFAAGEAVIDNNETTTDTITSVSFAITAMSPLSQGLRRGNWAVGLPADAVRDAFVVGGKVAAQKTRGTFYEDEAVDHPAFVVVDSYENSPPNGFELTYDTTPGAALRRLTLRKYNSSADIGLVGATRAATGFNNSVNPASSSFNVSGVVRNGTGDYTITFATAFVTADYMVSLAVSSPGDYAYTFSKAVGSCSIRVVGTGGTTPKDLAGVLDVVCHCGDI